MSCVQVGAVLGWSANTISRLERGLRPDTTAEEVSAILAAVGVTGPDRDRIMRMAKGYREQGWWEATRSHLTDQARTYLEFEDRATRIIDVEPLLVPGLLQTADYRRARIIEDVERPCVTVLVIPARVAAHPGLHGAFMVLEFADEPVVVHIEGRSSGIFPENPDEVAAYRLAVERLIDLTLGEQESLQLLHAVAEDLERAT